MEAGVYAGTDRLLTSIGREVVGVVPAAFAALVLIGEDVWTGTPAMVAVRVSNSEVRPVFYDVGDERKKEKSSYVRVPNSRSDVGRGVRVCFRKECNCVIQQKLSS